MFFRLYYTILKTEKEVQPMNFNFKSDSTIPTMNAIISTNPSDQDKWEIIKHTLDSISLSLTVINPKNNRQLLIKLAEIVSIESKNRYCVVQTVTNQQFYLNNRLKNILSTIKSTHFIQINNQTIVNLTYVKHFSTTTNARIEVVLQNDLMYFVNRHYIKIFRRNLSC